MSFFNNSKDVLDACLRDADYQQSVDTAERLLCDAVAQDRLIMACGNGGSASDADHFTAELICRYKQNRPAIRAVSLCCQGATATAISNDFGYEHIFARQVESLGRNQDVLVAFSTSGTSKNVLKALEQAQKQGVVTLLFTGSHTQTAAPLCDAIIAVPSADTPMIQQIHLMTYHYLCERIEAHRLRMPPSSAPD